MSVGTWLRDINVLQVCMTLYIYTYGWMIDGWTMDKWLDREIEVDLAANVSCWSTCFRTLMAYMAAGAFLFLVNYL